MAIMDDYWYTDNIGRKRHVQESSETYFEKEYKSRTDLISRFRFKDLTHKTSCPKCHENVYFIRHNGGSVWVDSLGWPWPKHACFEYSTEPKLYSFFQKKFTENMHLKTGVVRRATWQTSKNKQDTKIDLIIDTVEEVVNISIPAIHTLESIENTLVIMDSKNNKVVFSSYIESDILTSSGNKNVKKDDKNIHDCPYCKKRFSTILNKDNHISQMHPDKWMQYTSDKEVKYRIEQFQRCPDCLLLVKKMGEHQKKSHSEKL